METKISQLEAENKTLRNLIDPILLTKVLNVYLFMFFLIIVFKWLLYKLYNFFINLNGYVRYFDILIYLCNNTIFIYVIVNNPIY